jgi:hypothetical protein
MDELLFQIPDVVDIFFPALLSDAVKGMSAFSTPFIVSERLALSHPPRVSQ